MEIIKFLGGAAILTSGLVYLGKKVIEAFIAGRIESFKANLEKINLEHSIRFQSLHNERAETIKTLYEKITLLDGALYSALRRFQLVNEHPLEEKVKDISEKFNDLREFYLPKKIFFDESTCELIENILDAAKGVFLDITTLPVNHDNPEYHGNRELMNERRVFWDKARNIHETEIKDLKQRLEQKFRDLLGISA